MGSTAKAYLARSVSSAKVEKSCLGDDDFDDGDDDDASIIEHTIYQALC